MDIILNGEIRDIPETTTMSDLIRLLGLSGQRIAVEVNAELVPRSRHDQHPLAPGDRVEVIHAVGGG